MRATFIITLIVFQILLVFVHLAVFATMSAAFGFDCAFARAIFIILSLTFVTGSLLTHYSQNKIVQWYYTFAAYWFGLVHYLFVGGVLFFLTLVLGNVFNFIPNLALTGALCFGALFIVHLYGTWNSGRVELTSISVTLHNLPEFWKKHPLVFVSDVHLGAVRGVSFAKKVVSRIQALNPALVIIGGDLYDGVKCEAEHLVEPFKALTPKLGTLFITGNHEYYGDIPRYLSAIRGAGIRILNNETVEIEGIRFVGVDDRDSHDHEKLINILLQNPAAHDKPSIFLKHEPNNLDVAEKAKFLLGFFGHTHQGQMYPLNYVTQRMYNGFDYGLKKLHDMWIYTSSGAGTWGPPLRLGTKSEIVLVNFL